MAKKATTEDPMFMTTAGGAASTASPAAKAAAPGPEDNPLVIHAFSAENFKRLSVVRITPDGSLVTISGKNAQGKSSVLDAIEAAVGGERHVPGEAVRRGHDRGEVKLDLGDLIVKRTFTKSGGGTITVTAKDGTVLKSPQAVLDRLHGDLTFDPLGFIRMEAKKQRDILLRVAGLSEKLESIQTAKREAINSRVQVGREVDRLKGALASLPAVPSDTPDEEVSAEDIFDQMNAAQEVVAKNARLRQKLAAHKQHVASLQTNVAELEAKLEKARAELKTASDDLALNEPRVAALQDPDAEALRKVLTERESINAAVRTKQARARVAGELTKAERDYADWNRKVGDADVHANVLLESAEMPVKGLSVTDEGITLNKVPFVQASSAQQITAAVCIGLASNPRLRVMLVREGSFLDSEQLGTLAQIAETFGAQVWLERVTDGQAGVGVVIEDGEVQAEGGEA